MEDCSERNSTQKKEGTQKLESMVVHLHVSCCICTF